MTKCTSFLNIYFKFIRLFGERENEMFDRFSDLEKLS